MTTKFQESFMSALIGAAASVNDQWNIGGKREWSGLFSPLFSSPLVVSGDRENRNVVEIEMRMRWLSGRLILPGFNGWFRNFSVHLDFVNKLCCDGIMEKI